MATIHTVGCLILSFLWATNCAVLDPALFLFPSPPLTPQSDDLLPEDRWNENAETRVEREADLSVLPLERVNQTPEEETIKKSKTFWPQLRSTDFGIQSVHIPLTFEISGNYGRYGGGGGSGVIGSSYLTTNLRDVATVYGNYGKAGLAGSSYGSYGNSGASLYGNTGTRIYGSFGGPTWSGWGNGKWGHYGKG